MVKRTRIVTIGMIAVCALIGTSIYGDKASDGRDPTVSELLKRIEFLEARMALLEARAVQPALTQPFPEPKGWSKKQFNGSYYYIVPLNQANDPKANRDNR